jgi:hypothetical protein
VRALAAAGAAALLALAACGQDTGSPGGGASQSTVSGSALGQDFGFVAPGTGATFTSNDPSSGELTVQLCEADCPELGGVAPGTPTRAVTINVNAPAADLRSGVTVPIGNQASGRATVHAPTGDQSEEATGGEVVIDSSDIRQGGRTVGTFQLQLRDGGAISGFFDAPITRVSGSVVQLGGPP